jgi:hypothetical protein
MPELRQNFFTKEWVIIALPEAAPEFLRNIRVESAAGAGASAG